MSDYNTIIRKYEPIINYLQDKSQTPWMTRKQALEIIAIRLERGQNKDSAIEIRNILNSKLN